METNSKTLSVIDAHELMERYLPPPKFCVDTLLPHGLSILGGAPKVGKSWLVLDLCVHVAKGEPIWDLLSQQSAVLYLCLEDSEKRVQQRLLTITDDVPEERLFLATRCGKLTDDLCAQIREQITAHPTIHLVVVDTFQMVRGGDAELSYASDYEDVRLLKQLADELDVALLLVHHLRKRGDSDELNKLSGTTGITGAADAVFVLDKSERLLDEARLVCTGRDIESRELKLSFDKTDCVWNLVSDSIEQSSLSLPDELQALVELMRARGSFSGENTDLARTVSEHSGLSVSAKGLKQMMNKWQSRLEREGVRFRSYQSNGRRLVEVLFSSAVESGASDVSGAENAGSEFFVPCVSCVSDSLAAEASQ